jgi:hypothetical protein
MLEDALGNVENDSANVDFRENTYKLMDYQEDFDTHLQSQRWIARPVPSQPTSEQPFL